MPLSCCEKLSQRWIFALMSFLALFNAFAMRGCLNIAITEMVVTPEVQKSSVVIDNDACAYDDDSLDLYNLSVSNHYPGKELYDWDEYTQGIILSSFYWGYILTHIPGGLLAETYGGKLVLGFGIFSTSIFTLLTPTAIKWGDFYALIFLRALMGFGEGVTYPAINVLLAHWVSPEERSRISSFVHTGTSIGTIVSTTISGLILKHFNWQMVFYVFGIVGIFWYIFWLILCYDKPKDNPFISQDELEFLNSRLSKHTQEQRAPVPWIHILGSKPIWASVIGLIGFCWSNLTIMTDFPKYASGVLKLSVELNGYLTSFVHLCMLFGTLATSWLADWAINSNICSRTRVRKLGSVVALTFSSLFLVVASYVGCDRLVVAGVLAMALAMSGTSIPSIVINSLDLSPNYAGVIMGLANGIATLSGIVSPYLTGILTTHQTLEEWRLVFWIAVGISVLANLVFLIFGSADVQYWNDPTRNIDSSKRRAERKSYDSRTKTLV